MSDVWVVLHPAGVRVEVAVARVDEPVLLAREELEPFLKYEKAARAMRELGIEPPPFGAPAPTSPISAAIAQSIDAPAAAPVMLTPDEVSAIDAKHGQRSYKTEDHGILACRCNYVWSLTGDAEQDRQITAVYRSHIAQCGAYASWKSVDGHAEPGELKWGDA